MSSSFCWIASNCLNGFETHLNLVVGGVVNSFKSENMLGQTLNQSAYPVSLRARLYCRSASHLQLRSNGRSSLSMHRCSWIMTSWSGMSKKFTLRCFRGVTLTCLKRYLDNGRRHASIFPFVRGRTPSRTMIFMRRLQKGRHVWTAVRAVVFPMI